MDQQILGDLAKPILDSVYQRAVRTTKLKVIEYTPKAASESIVGAPGVILCFVARKGSDILKLAARATRDPKAAAELTKRNQAQTKKFTKVPLEKAVDMMVKGDVFAELRLGPEVLVQSLFIPAGADFVFEEFAYNGGPIPKDGFRLLERYKPGTSEALEAIILKGDPELTEAEMAALKSVPSDMWALNVSRPLCCGDSYTAIGVVVLAVAVTLVVACAAAMPEPKSLNASKIAKLGPAATARKLLEMRQAALLKILPRG